MNTFLLVHGAFSGGWSWRPVAQILASAGHTVFAPTLTGLGERSHLASPDVSLATHVEDVIAVLTYEKLHEVTLVGHSYGGAVVTAVAERVPERLSALVYVDALLPGDGQCVLDLLDPEAVAFFQEAVAAWGGGWQVPPTGLGDEREVPQPVKTFQEPLRLGNPASASLPRAYVACVHRDATPSPINASIERIARRVAAEGWPVVTLEAGHSAQREKPSETAVAILEAVQRARPVRGR